MLKHNGDHDTSGLFKLDRRWHCWSKSISFPVTWQCRSSSPPIPIFCKKSIFSSLLKVRTAALMWNSGVGFHSAELHHSLYPGWQKVARPHTYQTHISPLIFRHWSQRLLSSDGKLLVPCCLMDMFSICLASSTYSILTDSLWIVSDAACTLLKIKVIYWNLWFHGEPLTRIEPLDWTKRFIHSQKKGSLDY